MPDVRLTLISVGLALSCWCTPVIAGENPMPSCADAIALPAVRAQYPGHILGCEATTPPKVKRYSENLSFARLVRDVGSVCILMVLDATGKVVEARAIYPSADALLRPERRALMSTKMSPAEIEGNPQPSLTFIEVTD
uniref:TonB C-terminal domain-containing protein n=1 Tax=uncultured bacterium Bal2-29 TaxID=138999 RepID=Q99IY9_9BACT|nr:unknown [uncultured bacterium Bal2-29]